MKTMTTTSILIGTLVMILVTYLPRVLPLLIFKRPIQNPWIQSFLYYVPYAVLTAMTIPAVFTSTGALIPSLVGFVVAVVLALYRRSLITVALAAAGSAWLVHFMMAQFVLAG